MPRPSTVSARSRSEGGPPEPRRGRGYGRVPVAVLAATVALEVGERQSLAQAVEGLQETFAVSDRAIGFLPAAMILVGVVGAFPFGSLTDRVRRTGLLALGMAVWTIVMGLNAVAPGYGTLFAARLGVGAVEANSPAALSLLSDYYPVGSRARMIGLYQSGALLGAIVGLVLGGVAVAVGGWRWAFWMWVPAGGVVAWLVSRLPEPARGAQDADFHVTTAGAPIGGIDSLEGQTAAAPLHLPAPTRVGSLDYTRATSRQVYRELLGIRSMWFGFMALAISSLLLNGLQFWAVEYFKRVHGLEAAQAGAFTAVFGLGAAGGVLAGGYLADALLRRGVVNARVYVVAFSSVAATVTLVPAFLSTNLVLTGVLMIVGGTMLTIPIAPGDALVNDVVVAQLRGRAGTLRAVVRSIGAAGPVLVGVLSDAIGLRGAIAAIVPVYAVGGAVMLLAARTYPADLAFVAAESRRLQEER